MVFDSCGLPVSAALQAAIEFRNIPNIGVLKHVEFEELSWITDALPSGTDELTRVRVSQELSDLWQNADSAHRHELRESVRKESIAIANSLLSTASSSTGEAQHENSASTAAKRQKLDRLLVKKSLQVNFRAASATVETAGDTDNARTAKMQAGVS
jgi:hypothetical protein